jgi:hypothetical protein
VLHGYSPQSRRLEITLRGEKVGPAVEWLEGVAAFADPSDEEHMHKHAVRPRVGVAWKLTGSEALVAIGYDDGGAWMTVGATDGLDRWAIDGMPAGRFSLSSSEA